MTTPGDGRVSAVRRIEAPAEVLFARLADPTRHPSFDGSGMLRDGSGNKVVSAVGDSFTIKMHNDEMGDYEMRNDVVEYVPNRRIVWEPVMSAASRPEDTAGIGERAGHRWGYELEPDGDDAVIVTEIFDCTEAPQWLRVAVDDGNRWLASMASTLERLDEQCSQAIPGGSVPA